MGGGNIFIIGILIYILIVQKLDSRSMNPVKAELILMSAYFILTSIVMGIIYYVKDIPILINLFDFRIIATTFVQFVAAVFIFYKVEESIK